MWVRELLISYLKCIPTKLINYRRTSLYTSPVTVLHIVNVYIDWLFIKNFLKKTVLELEISDQSEKEQGETEDIG